MIRQQWGRKFTRSYQKTKTIKNLKNGNAKIRKKIYTKFPKNKKKKNLTGYRYGFKETIEVINFIWTASQENSLRINYIKARKGYTN